MPFARRSQPPRPHQWLLMGVRQQLPQGQIHRFFWAVQHAVRLPAPKPLKPLKPQNTSFGTPNRAGKSYPQATLTRNAQPRRQKLPQGQIHRFFWAVQPAVHQAFAAKRQPMPFASPQTLKTPKTPKTLKTFKTLQKRFGTPNRAGKSYPKARSIASSGRSSLPFARRSQPTGTPRPHQWLLMGVQACRLPAPKRLKPLKPLKRLKLKTFKTLQKRFGTPNRAGKSYPKARSIASSGRSSLPFARRSQPTGTPRPHQWLLLGVQACRLPAPKPLKPLKRLKLS